MSCSFSDEEDEEDDTEEIQCKVTVESPRSDVDIRLAAACAHYTWFISQARFICQQQPCSDRSIMDAYNCSVLNFYHNLHVVGVVATQRTQAWQQQQQQQPHQQQQHDCVGSVEVC
jgi:hypothetical protein